MVDVLMTELSGVHNELSSLFRVVSVESWLSVKPAALPSMQAVPFGNTNRIVQVHNSAGDSEKAKTIEFDEINEIPVPTRLVDALQAAFKLKQEWPTGPSFKSPEFIVIVRLAA
jgi:hypothetical protein